MLGNNQVPTRLAGHNDIINEIFHSLVNIQEQLNTFQKDNGYLKVQLEAIKTDNSMLKARLDRIENEKKKKTNQSDNDFFKPEDDAGTKPTLNTTAGKIERKQTANLQDLSNLNASIESVKSLQIAMTAAVTSLQGDCHQIVDIWSTTERIESRNGTNISIDYIADILTKWVSHTCALNHCSYFLYMVLSLYVFLLEPTPINDASSLAYNITFFCWGLFGVYFN